MQPEKQLQRQQTMGRVITQLGMNYETVLKHAGLNEVKHYFEQISVANTIIDNPHFAGLIEVIKGAQKKSRRLKGISDEGGNKPICGLHKLNEDNKTILIVEGEKTADQAQELFPQYSVMSWLGGSNAAGNVNWNKLKGRDVVIWPDNDRPGFEAASIISDRLNDGNLSLGRIAIVNAEVIEKLNLHEKWDLADQAA